jgi:hypothetical protein
MDPTTLPQADRDLIVAFTNAMRDIDTFAFLAKPRGPVGSSRKKRIWKKFTQQADKPIADSFRALDQLRQSSDFEIRELAEDAINKDDWASEELRRIGRRIKQDL